MTGKGFSGHQQPPWFYLTKFAPGKRQDRGEESGKPTNSIRVLKNYAFSGFRF
jgi:hypothetical protein